MGHLYIRTVNYTGSAWKCNREIGFLAFQKSMVILLYRIFEYGFWIALKLLVR